VFFGIGVLACNLSLAFEERGRAQVQTLRWKLFQTAGTIVCHGRQLF
jgi:hypothetical protein